MFLYKSVTSEGEICVRILASIATMKKNWTKKTKKKTDWNHSSILIFIFEKKGPEPGVNRQLTGN
jgi:hypothetical protein